MLSYYNLDTSYNISHLNVAFAIGIKRGLTTFGYQSTPAIIGIEALIAILDAVLPCHATATEYAVKFKFSNCLFLPIHTVEFGTAQHQ